MPPAIMNSTSAADIIIMCISMVINKTKCMTQGFILKGEIFVQTDQSK